MRFIKVIHILHEYAESCRVVVVQGRRRAGFRPTQFSETGLPAYSSLGKRGLERRCLSPQDCLLLTAVSLRPEWRFSPFSSSSRRSSKRSSRSNKRPKESVRRSRRRSWSAALSLVSSIVFAICELLERRGGEARSVRAFRSVVTAAAGIFHRPFSNCSPWRYPSLSIWVTRRRERLRMRAAWGGV